MRSSDFNMFPLWARHSGRKVREATGEVDLSVSSKAIQLDGMYTAKNNGSRRRASGKQKRENWRGPRSHKSRRILILGEIVCSHKGREPVQVWVQENWKGKIMKYYTWGLEIKEDGGSFVMTDGCSYLEKSSTDWFQEELHEFSRDPKSQKLQGKVLLVNNEAQHLTLYPSQWLQYILCEILHQQFINKPWSSRKYTKRLSCIRRV